ncbi:hypothetical protein FEM48_Zijuj09G0113700 [Ziziphus jujuba var. spinosa]|uniref:Extra-large guanine nucleotide-binding protein 1-like n=1 Tax=Ziziphus jujuba var. spinosa TaxID=714518 RepID=A0A978USQ6_ZIZJJ|nr:hypothetical protein FEM48_Zijuj09G0113700 [Ziziphus jujuba var. spinosa]
MVALLRKFYTFATSNPLPAADSDEDFNFDYSIAMEYHGPPVAYDIPQARPIDIHQIPTAAAVASASLLSSSLPVIQPIVRTSQIGKKTQNKVNKEEEAEQVSPCSAISAAEIGIVGGGGGDGKSVGSSRLVEKGAGFENYMNPENWESTESGTSSRSLSSEVFSHKEWEEEEDCGGGGESPQHARKQSVVTFKDINSDDIVVEEEYDRSEEVESAQERPKAERSGGKKGSCYRCNKGNRFTEKEVCIVCCAKYCFKCVLKAMGSMPEGRKCVTCIGYRIDETRRRKLGKCSRLLKRLLTDLEIVQIMKFEISCKVNQLPGNLVFVNEEPLSQEELVRLQSCQHPPRKLKPGSYWYDNMSGMWGKEGHKPCQIISAHLEIGGRIKQNASKGNTNVHINGREITKAELQMLKLAGVPCEGKINYWVSEDGSYQEEGMNNVKGKIWDKTGIKLVCALLLLPYPSGPPNPSAEEGDRILPTPFEEKKLKKLLLVGSDKSGTSTIFKQAKFIYKVPFTEDERENIKSVIQSKLFCYLALLLEGRERFEEESLIETKRHVIDPGSSDQNEVTTIYSISERLKAFVDWLLKVMASGNLEATFPAANQDYAPFIEELWNDAAIQATYNRRNELETLPGVATYFLNRAVEILRMDYEPSDMDILYAEGISSSNSLMSMEFSFPESIHDNLESIYEHDLSMRFQFIRIHPSSLGEHCKWLDMFEDVDIVLFCVSLADYDEFFEDNNGVCMNKMMASKQLFESIITHPLFDQKNFLLILNKYDLLEEKIEEKIPLSRCEWFREFNPVISNNPGSSNNNSTNPPLAHRSFQYIAMKFKRLFHTLTDRKLYVSAVTGLEPDTVEEALKNAREILKWVEEEPKRNGNEASSTSIDASSSSSNQK